MMTDVLLKNGYLVDKYAPPKEKTAMDYHFVSYTIDRQKDQCIVGAKLNKPHCWTHAHRVPGSTTQLKWWSGDFRIECSVEMGGLYTMATPENYEKVAQRRDLCRHCTMEVSATPKFFVDAGVSHVGFARSGCFIQEQEGCANRVIDFYQQPPEKRRLLEDDDFEL